MVKHSCCLDRFHCLLKPGFLSCHLESFLLDLERRGYTALTAKGYADSVCHFAHWAQRQNLGVDALSDQVLTRFGRHRCRCPVDADNTLFPRNTSGVCVGSFATCALKG